MLINYKLQIGKSFKSILKLFWQYSKNFITQYYYHNEILLYLDIYLHQKTGSKSQLGLQGNL